MTHSQIAGRLFPEAVVGSDASDNQLGPEVEERRRDSCPEPKVSDGDCHPANV